MGSRRKFTREFKQSVVQQLGTCSAAEIDLLKKRMEYLKEQRAEELRMRRLTK